MKIFSQLQLGAKLAKSFISYRLGKPTLTYVVYAPTARCNLKCYFCDMWRRKERELDTATSLKIIDRIAEAGAACIDFTGGEPLLRKDLVTLARRARKLGVTPTLNTNGTLVTPELAKELDECFEAIAVSIDGFEYTHDKLRGVKGCFKKAMRGIAVLREHTKHARIGVNSTILRENIGEIPLLLEYFQDKVDFASFAPISPYPPSKMVSPAQDEVKRTVQSLIALKEENPGYLFPPKSYIQLLTDYFSRNLKKVCDAGELYCFIDCNGDVTLCSTMKLYSIGSAIEGNLKEAIQKNLAGALSVREKCSGCLMLCSTLPSMFYNQSLIECEAPGQAFNWVK